MLENSKNRKASFATSTAEVSTIQKGTKGQQSVVSGRLRKCCLLKDLVNAE